MYLGSYIKTNRQGNQDTQRELAHKLGVKRQAVSKWESDESMPTLENLMQLVDVYQLDFNDIMKSIRYSLNHPHKRKEG